MAKNIHNLRCIHCLETPDEVTYDHAIPKRWYSDQFSKSVTKPKAPACYKCNQELGRKEKLLSHIMWMCMPEDHPLTPELRERVYRAWGMALDGKPLEDLSNDERRRRLNYAREMYSKTSLAGELDERRILPGFSFHPGLPKEKQRFTKIDYDLIQDVAKKVVRGLEYTYQNQHRYIELPYRLEVHFPSKSQPPELELIRNLSHIFKDGTNTIQRGIAPTEPLEPIYIIRLWDLWEIWGVIIHEDRWDKVDESINT